MGTRLDCELCGKVIPKEDTVEGEKGFMSKTKTLESKYWFKLSEGDNKAEAKDICRECHSQIKSRIAKLCMAKGDR